MPQLVLIRHGQSTWNLENRFTGWWDVGLSERGEAEAHEAGAALKAAGHEFDIAFSSVLTRAIKTLDIVLEEMGALWIPVIKDWRFNERHYGGLTGLNKAETAVKHGDNQVKIWRRSYDIPPPPLASDSRYDVSRDRRYADVPVPQAESLRDTIARALPAFEQLVVPQLRADKRVIIAAHGNSLRALVKHLSNISDKAIVEFEIPTATPIVYQFDRALNVTDRRFLRVE